MKVLVFSDLYQVEKVPEEDCDLVVILGKVTRKVIDKINEVYSEQPKLGLLSNTCAPDLYNNTEIINIHEKVVDFEGMRFAGFGGVPAYENRGSGYFTEEYCAAFIKQLAISNVDVLFSYSHVAYGDIDGAEAKDGFRAYHEIFTKNLTKYLIHGRLHQNLKRRIAKVIIHMVYEQQLIIL